MYTKKTGLFVVGIMLGVSAMSHADSIKTICGPQDDRQPSTNPKVARILQPTARAGCTVTMIGKVCAISAGHCYSTFAIAEFNTPESDSSGRIQHPAPEDIYEVDKDSVVYNNGGYGNDYAVLRLRGNSITGALPGVLQGSYPVSFKAPKKDDLVRITGYGADSNDNDRNFAQQTHSGPVYETRGSVLNHRADTMGGNSGSSVINEETGEIVAIHTHGGCSSRGGANASTLIAANQDAKDDITACLKWEEDNL